MNEPIQKPKDGGQAFPFPGSVGLVPRHGMTLRDWFAGYALVGMMLNLETIGDAKRGEYARRAYRMADAMLAEREKEHD